MAEKEEVKVVAKNCPVCKKIMSRARWYYRNGVYYCNPNCYRKSKQTAAQAAK